VALFEATGRSLGADEQERLIAAGPPAACTTPGVYDGVGCEEPPSDADVAAQRKFDTFTVFAGKNGFETSYQEAAKVFADRELIYGFKSMFEYRFS